MLEEEPTRTRLQDVLEPSVTTADHTTRLTLLAFIVRSSTHG